MNADIDERSEVGNIRNNAFQFHSHLEICYFLDPLLKCCILKLLSWISSWLFEFANNIPERWFADGICNIFF